jgi:transposase
VKIRVYVISVLRCLRETPFERISCEYDFSYISEIYPNLSLSASQISRLMKSVGSRRDLIVRAMNEISDAPKNIIIDGSRIRSWSKELSLPEVGHNHNHSWMPQINMIYIFTTGQEIEPIFYKCVAGNISDTGALKLTLEERQKDVSYTIFADASFSSHENINEINEFNVKYIIPLKRNSLEALGINADYKKASSIFTYNKRIITAYDIQKDDYRVILFLDESKKADELFNIVMRIENKNEKILNSNKSKHEETGKIDPVEAVSNKEKLAGAIIIKTNSDESPQYIYELYKKRSYIEQSFDTLKNMLGQDHSYMHDDKTFECWCFFNHISLLLLYRVYNILSKEKLISKYSLQDLFAELGHIYKMKIGSKWETTEITKKTKLLCEKISFPLGK